MNMWKTVSARIRGADQELINMGEDTEGMVKSTSKLREDIKALTGFDIMKDENTFKNMREIIIGIGEEWKNLTDIQQAGLLEKLAGKNHANSLAATLNNIDMIKESYDIAENSAGSAMREQAKYEESIQYSLDRMSASFQEFANVVLSSDLLKGIVDFGDTLLNVLTKIMDVGGGIPALLTAIGGVAFFKNLD